MGLFKSKKFPAEVMEHWYTLIPGHHFSSSEFYEQIAATTNAQRIPHLRMARVDLSEGGPLSDNREYLRMKRERLIFDICAAPIGVNYFFSYRFYVEPVNVGLWRLLSIFLLLDVGIGAAYRYIDDLLWATGTVIAFFAISIFLLRNAVGLGLKNLDFVLLNTPILGPVYERFFRVETFYRHDTRIAYCSLVSEIIKQEVEHMSAVKGVQLLREHTHSPLLRDLYETKEVVPQESAEMASVRGTAIA